MLPCFQECEKRIQNHSYSSFDRFWRYKIKVESNGASILDDSQLHKTVMQLIENLLLRDEWQLWWTGIASLERIEEILKNIRDDYNTIKNIKLGDGQIANRAMSDALSRIYAGFYLNTVGVGCGITHYSNRKDSPDKDGKFYVLGRSKLLMFIWGQTPGFDYWIKKGLKQDGLFSTCPWILDNKWKPAQFCDTIKELDKWVITWEEQEAKGFQKSLSKDRPIGRIIDMIYWRQ